LLTAGGPQEIAAHLKILAAHPGHWPAIAFSNHDVIRTVTLFGGDGKTPDLAKAMLALLFVLRGTALLYQGEELGLPEVDLHRDQLRDPVGDLYYPLFKGRDGCRTPMPWDAAAPNLGFTRGVPWLPLGRDHRALAVSAQEKDAASPLNFARAMLKARKNHPALRLGSLALLDSPDRVLAFIREHEDERILCVFNLSDEPRSFEHGLERFQEKCTAVFRPEPRQKKEIEHFRDLTKHENALARPLDFGTGAAKHDGTKLELGPLAAFFALL
jgi:alpha-glucosidase